MSKRAESIQPGPTSCSSWSSYAIRMSARSGAFVTVYCPPAPSISVRPSTDAFLRTEATSNAGAGDVCGAGSAMAALSPSTAAGNSVRCVRRRSPAGRTLHLLSTFKFFTSTSRDLFLRSHGNQVGDHIVMAPAARHAERRPPFAVGGGTARHQLSAARSVDTESDSPDGLFDPDAGVHVCTAGNEQLHHLQLSRGARLHQGIFIAV